MRNFTFTFTFTFTFAFAFAFAFGFGFGFGSGFGGKGLKLEGRIALFALVPADGVPGGAFHAGDRPHRVAAAV